jgi:uncharacterized SAM-binding protein YcdF (DUF218 family)
MKGAMTGAATDDGGDAGPGPAGGHRLAVVVLGAPLVPGRPVNPALARRARHGAALVRAHGDALLIGVGGGRCPEADAIAAIARDLGVPDRALLAESRSVNTLQNAVLAARLLRRHGVTRVRLVTDWPHVPRAWLCFRLAGVACRPAPVPGTAWKPTFWLREAAAVAVYLQRLPRLLRTRRRLRRPGRPM